MRHMSCVMCQVSGVTCQVSRVRCLVSHIFFYFIFFYKVVGLVGGGSVINGAYPVKFYTVKAKIMYHV